MGIDSGNEVGVISGVDAPDDEPSEDVDDSAGSCDSVLTCDERICIRPSCSLSSSSRWRAEASWARSCSSSVEASDSGENSGGGVRPSEMALRRWFSCSSSATRLKRDENASASLQGREQEQREKTHISMSSNSSRFRWRLRKAAARFLTRRASRLVSPVTSGGTKSFVLMHARGFFEELEDEERDGRLGADELADSEASSRAEKCSVDSAWDDIEGEMGEAREAEESDGEEGCGGKSKSKSWCVGRQVGSADKSGCRCICIRALRSMSSCDGDGCGDGSSYAFAGRQRAAVEEEDGADGATVYCGKAAL